MKYEFFTGAQNVLKECKEKCIKTAFVTSSDKAKISTTSEFKEYG